MLLDWLKDLIGEIPTEAGIDCGSCGMVAEGRFASNLKCCTFLPFIPNFQVSSLPRVDWRQADVSPLGFYASREYQREFARQGGARGFGRILELACPFLDEAARCRIWSARPSPCVGYHCRSARGAKGSAYWQAFESLMRFVEVNLSIECGLELGLTGEEVELCLALLPGQNLSVAAGPQEAHAEIFRRLDLGPPERWFLRAREWAGDMNPADIRRRLGAELELKIQDLVTMGW